MTSFQFVLLYLISDPTVVECTATVDKLDLHTPNKYEYTYLEDKGMCVAKQGAFQFWVKASNDVHITLADAKGNDDTIEVVIGGWSDSKSVLRFAHQGSDQDSESGSWLSDSAYRPFWISWNNNGLISVGTGTNIGLNTFLSKTSSQAINYVGVATAFGSDGDWAFGYGEYIH